MDVDVFLLLPVRLFRQKQTSSYTAPVVGQYGFPVKVEWHVDDRTLDGMPADTLKTDLVFSNMSSGSNVPYRLYYLKHKRMPQKPVLWMAFGASFFILGGFQESFP